MQLEFLSLKLTPGEKKVGIASIRWLGKIVLPYLIFARKDGNGYFAAPPSMKIKDPVTGEDKYTDAFMVDSRYENEEIIRFVMLHVNKEMGNKSTVAPIASAPNSVFKDDEIPF